MVNSVADRDAPISMLSVRDYFPQLSKQKQLYAHYMSKASHAGTRIVLRQVSKESESIYDTLLYVHLQLDGNYPDEPETKLYLDYFSQFLSNLGNYKSFGDAKFVPGCSKEFFTKILKSASLKLENPPPSGSKDFNTLGQLVDEGIYFINEKIAFLGYPSEGFVSSYYLGGKVSAEDMALLKQEVFGRLGILPENTRIEKLKEKEFAIWVASENKTNTLAPTYPNSNFTLSNGSTVSFKFGDHSRELGIVASYLQKAKEYAANDTQRHMLDQYIDHFTSGSSHAHKEAQKLWVKDISPAIETNIGFIETYREPSGIIGEFESLVAIQNEERTAKFSTLVSNAQDFITLLPWDSAFEKNEFHPPDFTSIEVLTFAGSGIPAGINIPNYDDVRLNVGFKNVSLGNILSASAKGSSTHPPSFIAPEDRPIYDKCQGDSFEVQVGIHELLGHGSGKLLSETKDGFNFDKENPPLGLDGKPVTTYYKLGETWGSKFSSVAGSFEECRAEVIAMYLITNRKLLEIFGFKTKEDQDNIIYAGYLQMARAGLLALEYWDPESGKWGQPHMQARFSIMKTFLKHSPNPKFLQIEPLDDGKDLVIRLDKSLIETAGHECVKDYLQHLHIYKSTADVENGSKYYNERSQVTPDLAKLRDLVVSKRLPRKQFVQANTILTPSGEVELKEYEETPFGLIKSFIERET
ncbi:ZYRO0A05346p [Zygosaccharomyces rouxii]|uniref:Dipeptidyl peptidase 3 n=1 Tax=Zygosaccharomyces rouxii (strain ATCC 2623 / CBS 732 / NBRC 1130 / NCYC 568 / NRRL Y-229) TaxID=559307 RepID=C5DPQ9_ZYGRC|nr:uncharacterized protein ZYRO0A05346g [Zygosaccharomyces rouxii]KAH9198810.1 peptidase family M49-domain-containing protein [Zygosaccharomyces rouxii]CAR25670.1 ZYRO0A05346p [Zygosaccharomyces rouxii]